MQKWHSHSGCLKAFQCRTKFFQNLFLPYSVNNWIKLDPSRRCAESHSLFRKKLVIRPIGNSTYRIHNPTGIKLLIILRVGFSHLWEHKFRHKIADTLNPLCACALETECTKHFFLRCQNYISLGTTLMNELRDINSSVVCAVLMIFLG